MADSGATPHNHLGTEVPSGQLDEKKDHAAEGESKELPPKAAAAEGEEEEDEDEDIDALIEELESEDANIDNDDEDETQPGGARPVSEDLLQTDTRTGLTSSEVLTRRKKFGLNQMKEEKENLILKFMMYFVGPIQFVMEAAAVLAAGLQVRAS
jgi:H+-transporting ATPase